MGESTNQPSCPAQPGQSVSQSVSHAATEMNDSSPDEGPNHAVFAIARQTEFFLPYSTRKP